MKQKYVDVIGWVASFMAVLMFSSYIDQIRLNMSGNTGSVLLPVTTTLNCTCWVMYAWLKEKKDWPILFCNALGIIFGSVTAYTAVSFN